MRPIIACQVREQCDKREKASDQCERLVATAINYLSFNFIFCLQEIDGKALLLLTREMIMSYMGLKLGPAIKLLCFIDELKNKKYT